MSKMISLVEVGLRDGLQNEKQPVSIATKVELAKKLTEAGLTRVEIGAFVRPDWVPQMAGSKEVIAQLLGQQKARKINKAVQFSALVPNEKGMLDAIESGIKEIAVFAASSEAFSQKNINCSIDESFNRFVPVFALAKKNKIKVRGYLSTCFGCPFEGEVSEKVVIKLARRMIEMGAFEVSIGDTIGVAHVGQVNSMMKKLTKVIPAKKIAGHFHDTRGQALANILASYELGIRVFDTSIGGLGGCPYAPGATGNVATEDVVYMFQKMGAAPEVDLQKLTLANHWMAEQMAKPLPSKVGQNPWPKELS